MESRRWHARERKCGGMGFTDGSAGAGGDAWRSGQWPVAAVSAERKATMFTELQDVSLIVKGVRRRRAIRSAVWVCLVASAAFLLLSPAVAGSGFFGTGAGDGVFSRPLFAFIVVVMAAVAVSMPAWLRYPDFTEDERLEARRDYEARMASEYIAASDICQAYGLRRIMLAPDVHERWVARAGSGRDDTEDVVATPIDYIEYPADAPRHCYGLAYESGSTPRDGECCVLEVSAGRARLMPDDGFGIDRDGAKRDRSVDCDLDEAYCGERRPICFDKARREVALGKQSVRVAYLKDYADRLGRGAGSDATGRSVNRFWEPFNIGMLIAALLCPVVGGVIGLIGLATGVKPSRECNKAWSYWFSGCAIVLAVASAVGCGYVWGPVLAAVS